MGFSSLIDILGSTIVGGMLFMILLRINDTAVQNTFTYGGDLIVQQNLVAVVELLEYDFKKIGYCSDWEEIPDPSKAIISADSTSIAFLTDIEPDGTVDTMYYSLGSTDELSHTDNPRDRMLYRIINDGDRLGSNLGITEFKILYFNALGNQIPFPITVPGEIYTMQINIRVENSAAYDQYYSSAFWRQIRLASKNLRNR